MPVIRGSHIQQHLLPAFRPAERRAVEKQPDHLSAWILSVLIHSLAIGSALALANGMAVRPVKPSFRWDVSIIEASPLSPITSEQQTKAEAAPVPSTQLPDTQADHPRHRRATPTPRQAAPPASRILAQSDVDVPVFHNTEGSPQAPDATMEQTALSGNENKSAEQSTGTVAAQERSADIIPSQNRMSLRCLHQTSMSKSSRLWHKHAPSSKTR